MNPGLATSHRPRPHRLLFPWVIGALVLCGCATNDPNQRLEDMVLAYDDTIVTTSARTVDFNGQALVPRYLRIEKSGAGGKLNVDLTVSNVVLGVNRDMTLRVAVPYISKRLKPASGASVSAEGIGDVQMFGKWRFYQKTGVAKTTEAALLFGVELPTGQNDVRRGGVRLPAPLQPGSGGVDGILGGAFTRVDGRWQVNSDLIVRANSAADGYRFGSGVSANIGAQFRLSPKRFTKLDQLTINLVGELNSNWTDQDRLNSGTVANSGGFKLFATPGVQAILNRFLLFETAVQIPLIMNLGGDALEEDFVFIFGLRSRF